MRQIINNISFELLQGDELNFTPIFKNLLNAAIKTKNDYKLYSQLNSVAPVYFRLSNQSKVDFDEALKELQKMGWSLRIENGNTFLSKEFQFNLKTEEE